MPRFPALVRPGSSVLVFTALALAGCPAPADPTDAGTTDTGPVEIDAGPRLDSGPRDAGMPDVGSDAGSEISCTGADCEVVELAALLSTTCVRRMNGDVICWGRALEGQLGDGRMSHVPGCTVAGEPIVVDCSSTPVLVDLPAPALELVGASFEICAVTGTGREHRCWGEGSFNIGTTLPARNYTPIIFDVLAGVTLSHGQGTMCWLDAAGDPFCIGHNGVGQLGDGSLMDRTAPVPVMRAGTPPTPLADETILELEVGRFSGVACARTATELLCWGANESGQLGRGTMTHQDCASGPELRDCSPMAVPVTIDATMVADFSIGTDHVCALMTDGTVMCWGENIVGQLGTGDTATRTTPTLVAGITDATEVVTTGGTTCVLHADGTISCWGRSNVGQVGDGMMTHVAGVCGGATLVDCQPTPVTVMGIDDATTIALGFDHACALRATGGVSCWGNNDRHQLGNGDTTRAIRYAPVPVPFLP